MRDRRVVSPPDALHEFLRGVSFLATVDDRALDHFAQALEWIAVPGGALVFSENDPPDGLYLLRSGRVRIERADGTLLADLGPPETFGELALLTGRNRTAHARAARDVVAARLPPDRFDRFFTEEPAIARSLTATLARWLTGERERRVHTPIVTLTPGHPDAPLDTCRAAIERALPTIGRTAVLTRADIETAIGEPLPRYGLLSSPQFSAWSALIDRIEATVELLVLIAPHDDPVFRRLCARQSDTVLLVVAPEQHRTLLTEASAIRAETPDDVTTRLELVLLRRRSASLPRNTAAWLHGQGLRAHHHLALDSAGDALRLLRRVTDRAVGVVLSGGGARGFTHIGALHALVRAGVPIDAVGGTSMGAIIAAQFAAGWTEDQMIARNHELWNRHRPHRALTVPITSLVGARPARDMLEDMFGDTRFEDLPLRCFATSSNLTRARVEVHARGLLRHWLAASMSIPGIGPPVPTPEGDLLVDGGILDNLPVETMRAQRVRHIVAMNASPRVDPRIRSGYVDIPGWATVLRDRLGRGEQPALHPHLLELLTRAVMLRSAEQATSTSSTVDLWIEPDAASYPLLDMTRTSEIAAIGRQAVEALAASSAARLTRLTVPPPGRRTRGEAVA